MFQRSIFTLALTAIFLPRLCLAQNPHVYNLSGDVAGTHDPSIIKEGNTWYVFATGKAPDGGQFAVRCSQTSNTGSSAATSSTRSRLDPTAQPRHPRPLGARHLLRQPRVPPLLRLLPLRKKHLRNRPRHQQNTRPDKP